MIDLRHHAESRSQGTTSDNVTIVDSFILEFYVFLTHTYLSTF